MPDFWLSCGYRLLTVGADRRLTLTDDFLRALLLRPELAPIPESCAAELALHEKLIASPRAAVRGERAVASIADADARENYGIWLRFRERIVAAPSLEAAYVTLFREGVDVPPLLVHQLTEILLRHILGAAADPIEARVAEMLFRPQNIAVTPEGAVMAADTETVEAAGHHRRVRQRSASCCRRTARRSARSTSIRSIPPMRRPTGTATSGTISR